MPKFLYFDLGNVLLSFCHDRMTRQVAAVFGVEEAKVRAATLDGPTQSSPQWRFEQGLIGEPEFYEHLCTALGSRPDRAALDLAASDIFAPIDQTWHIVRRLHAGGARLGILSNTNPTHWRFVTDGRYPILTECFELAVLSYEAQSMKPDRVIYEQAIARAGEPAGEVFFVDDREDNIAGALEAGLDAVVFRSAQGLERDLIARGVLSGE